MGGGARLGAEAAVGGGEAGRGRLGGRGERWAAGLDVLVKGWPWPPGAQGGAAGSEVTDGGTEGCSRRLDIQMGR